MFLSQFLDPKVNLKAESSFGQQLHIHYAESIMQEYNIDWLYCYKSKIVVSFYRYGKRL